MTLPRQKTGPSPDEIAVFLRFNRRALAVLLCAVVFLGATSLALAVWPGSLLAHWPVRAPLLFPSAIVVAWGALRASLWGRRWRADSAEIKTVLGDEFRRTNLSRAQRVALIVVLAAQAPLGILVMRAPAREMALAMAGTTISLGLATLIAAFLVFDRE